ncbi:unnamed protein product [Linum trigynum]|uniref:RNase H type-1 domain-containing protein n=1 Tax=Linum trigynum TaxID=586398 RepID=A0AAV2GB55_9ROSI
MWYLWKENCNHLNNNHKMAEDEIIPRAMAWLEAYMDALGPLGTISIGGNRNPANENWTPPPEVVFKLNADAGFLQQTETGLGCILRDWWGEFRGATAMKDKGKCRPIEAKARAIWMGLREANRRVLSPLVVESDCLVLINKLKKKEGDRTELGSWCEEIWRMADANASLYGKHVEWSFSPRKSNTIAHWLAHSVGVWEHQVVWVDEPPLSLRVLIEAELGRAPPGPL